MARLLLPDGEAPLAAVGLDLDGTIRDTGLSTFEALLKAVAELGGRPMTYEYFVDTYNGDRVSIYREAGVVADDETIKAAFRKHNDGNPLPEPYPDVIPFLTYALDLKLDLFVVTNSRHAHVHDWLKNHEMHAHFGHVASDTDGKAEHILFACRQLGCKPEEACYVGDMGSDMRDARKAGLMPIGLTRGNATGRALFSNGAAAVFDGLEEFSKIIR
jgi:phosphoglycolate phosphatase-like HAD superfamily hydrolase